MSGTFRSATSARRGLKRVALRRLNRFEYQHTMHDLLGIEVNLMELLPEDGSAHGFDKVSSALTLSPVQVEKYLEAAVFLAFDEKNEAVGFAEVFLRGFANGCDTSPVAFLEGTVKLPPQRVDIAKLFDHPVEDDLRLLRLRRGLTPMRPRGRWRTARRRARGQDEDTVVNGHAWLARRPWRGEIAADIPQQNIDRLALRDVVQLEGKRCAGDAFRVGDCGAAEFRPFRQDRAQRRILGAQADQAVMEAHLDGLRVRLITGVG